MKSSYISSVFFRSLDQNFWSLFRNKNNFNPQTYFWKFKVSGYERALFTLKMYESADKKRIFAPNEICLYVGVHDVEENLEFLATLRQQGVKILIGGSDAKILREKSFNRIFEEVIFLVYKVPLAEDLDILARTPKLRWIFSPKMSEDLVQISLEKIAQKNIRRKISSYLEMPSQKNLDFWFSPETEVLFKKGVDGKIATSVVIPFQDNLDELLLTLRYLVQSFEGTKEIEIVVVDDSSSHKHCEILKNYISKLEYAVVYLKLKRDRQRVKGDRQFRAGIARNYGAAISAGEELVFLDSDILIGKDFWSQVTEERSWGGHPLMPKRFFLKPDLAPEKFSFEQLQIGEHTQLSWGGHWEDFYRGPKNDSTDWKWTSTFCLVIPKNVFFEAGGFRRGFYRYGFEDTDLGYRLHSKGFKLRLLNTHTFHLPVKIDRSEYSGKTKLRKMLMKESFKVFRRSVADPELLKTFRHLID